MWHLILTLVGSLAFFGLLGYLLFRPKTHPRQRIRSRRAVK